jgi:uncharacterized protein (TIGR03435 family)
MEHRQSSHLAYAVIASFLLLPCLTAVAWVRIPVQAGVDSNVTPRVYEIVSIKPQKPGTPGSFQDLPNGFRDTGVVFAALVREAYGLILPSQVVGMPAWAESEPYDVETRVDAGTVEEWKRISEKDRWKQEQPMLQALLADRCRLRIHRETRELPLYDLVIAKGGLKMREAAPKEETYEYMGGGRLTAHAMTMDSLVYGLAGTDGRLIVDKTGLDDEKFDFQLTWASDSQPATANSGPSLFTALEEQLGLKLVPLKGPVDVIVIDHMEKPSPN